MQSRDVQVFIAVILAGVVGFALAMLIIENDEEPVIDEPAATTVQPTAPQPTEPAGTQPQATVPSTPETRTDPGVVTEGPDDASCIQLWNRENNTTPQGFLADLQNRQAVRVNVGATEQAPKRCLVTLIANDGSVYRFSEAAGATFPYAQTPTRMQSSALTPGERETDALPESGGTLSPR